MIRSAWLGSVLAVVALSMAGFAYAAWTDTLHVEGTISTADVDATWDVIFEIEPIVNFNAPPGQVPPRPNLVQCTADPSSSGADRAINLEILNAFPNAGCRITVAGTIRSTIPVLLNGIVPSAKNASGNSVLGTEIDVGIVTLQRLADSPAGEPGCDFDSPLTGDQLLMDGDGLCGVVTFKVLPGAKMKSAYLVSARIDLSQWNLAGGS